MKLNSRNRSTFLLIAVLGFVVGSLAWAVFERVLATAGIDLSLEIGPVGFDLAVLSAHVVVNPGSILGVVGGILLFSAL